MQLDYTYLLLIADQIINRMPSANQKYVLNNSLYKTGNEYRYLKFEQNTKNGKRKFSIDSIEFSNNISNILSYCVEARTEKELIRFLESEFEVDIEECKLFLKELIERKVLLPDLLPNITGENYLDRVINSNGCDIHQLDLINSRFNRSYDICDSGFHKTVIETDSLIQELVGEEGNDKSKLYVNTERSYIKDGIPSEYQNKIIDGLFCIDKLLNKSDISPLKSFANTFYKKFERRWVPLLVALDPELGVGYESLGESYYSSPLLSDVELEYFHKEDRQIEWTPTHTLLLNKWNELQEIENGIPTLILNDEELDNLSNHSEDVNLPQSISVIFRMLGESVYIEQAGGATAAALLGRFTPFNPGIKEAVHQISKIEESVNESIAFAEIAHICDTHISNIERREITREYEIPILTGSTLPEKKQIQVNDLWISVFGDEIILWSKKLQRRVIPRLTSAFNYVKNDLPVFRFLCDLQYQGIKSNMSFDISNFFPNLSFYPRVKYRSAILNLASWNIKKRSIEEILMNGGNENLPARIRNFAKKMKWPRYISMNRYDHYIVIDTENDEDLILFTKNLKKQDNVVIREFPFIKEEKEEIEDDSRSPYIEQFITALYHEHKTYDSIAPEFDQLGLVKTVERNFLPGSNWAYFKIYCHPVRANELLLGHIIPLCKRWTTAGFLNQWFFVRYADPEFHLRIRFNIDPVHSGIVIKGLNRCLTPLIKTGLMSNVQVAVYERELERYDPSIIEELEKAFCISSTLIAGFFQDSPEEDKNIYHFYEIAYCSLTVLLDAFCYKIEDKIRLFNQLYFNLKYEFHISESFNDQLKRKFRDIRLGAGTLSLENIITKFKLNSELSHFKYIHEQIEKLIIDWPLHKKDKLIGDLIHMHLNRLFPESARKNELIVYYCLWRQYKSDEGRNRKDLRRSFATD